MKDRSYLNRRCPECGWSTHSSMSRGYKYCPICRTELEEYDMRDKGKASLEGMRDED